MLPYYGDKTQLRVLDETEFWKHQEEEHTVVIRDLAPNLEPEYVELLKQWEQAFAQTNAATRRYIETLIRTGNQLTPAFCQQVIELVQCSIAQSRLFIQLLNNMAQNSKPISSSPSVIVVINHIRRESEYFIGVAETILYQPPLYPFI